QRILTGKSCADVFCIVDEQRADGAAARARATPVGEAGGRRADGGERDHGTGREYVLALSRTLDATGDRTHRTITRQRHRDPAVEVRRGFGEFLHGQRAGITLCGARAAPARERTPGAGRRGEHHVRALAVLLDAIAATVDTATACGD